MNGRGSLPAGRVFGIPVYLHFSWFLVVALFSWSLAQGYFPTRYPDLPAAAYWSRGLSATLLLFASVLAHEFGHALVARRLGVGVESITLFIFGGVASLSDEPLSGGDEVKIAAAGPAVSLAAALLFHAASLGTGGSPAAVARLLAHLNLVLVVFNLVPAFPLDGGRILRGLLWRRRGRMQATRIAVRFGTGFAYLLFAYGALGLLAGQVGAGLWSIFIGWFLRSASRAAYQQVSLEHALAGIPVRDVVSEDGAAVPAEATVQEAVTGHFVRHGRDGFPVTRDGKVVGLIGLEDLREVPRGEWSRATVEEVMRPVDAETTIRGDSDLVEALRRLATARGNRLLVRSGDGAILGLVTQGELLRRWQMSRELE